MDTPTKVLNATPKPLWDAEQQRPSLSNVIQKAKNKLNVPLPEKFLSGILDGVRNISVAV